ncbi:MAG: LemA family protein [Lactobacillales bacterium]|jgi:LemA protein|nr:LemA family protein [Lactobacillales bacterium]
MALIILLVVIVVVVAFVIGVYNSLAQLRVGIQNASSQIKVQLQRRFDLIPNLVETVKGYKDYEQETLTKVTEMRTQFLNTNNVAEQLDINNQVTGALNHLFAVSENYPDLKASENFRELQLELTNTENKIAYSRQFLNDSVARFNTKLVTFPSNIVASIFGFKPADFLEISEPAAAAPVKVQF